MKKNHSKKNKLDGNNIEIEQVPICTSLLLSNISDKTTNDALELTLESPAYAGLDSIESLQFEKGTWFAIVRFNDREGIL